MFVDREAVFGRQGAPFDAEIVQLAAIGQVLRHLHADAEPRVVVRIVGARQDVFRLVGEQWFDARQGRLAGRQALLLDRREAEAIAEMAGPCGGGEFAQAFAMSFVETLTADVHGRHEREIVAQLHLAV